MLTLVVDLVTTSLLGHPSGQVEQKDGQGDAEQEDGQFGPGNIVGGMHFVGRGREEEIGVRVNWMGLKLGKLEEELRFGKKI